MKNTPSENITALRRLMAERGLDAYVIPVTDPHMSEYLPAHWRALQWASGFTGSAGTLVITRDFAGLWTDSRYFIQAEQQLAGSGIELVKLVIPHTPEFVDWLADKLAAGDTIGLDGNLLSRLWYQALEAGVRPHGIQLDPHADLVTPLWQGRESLPGIPVYEHLPKYTGAGRKEKLALIRERLAEKKATHTVISSLDDIAWAFNLRGKDVPYNPLFVAHAVIGPKDAALFIDPVKMPDDIRRKLSRAGIKVHPYTAVTDYLGKIPAKATILIDPKRVSQNLPGAFPAGAKVLDGINVTTWLKACKAPAEVEHTRKTMVKDGVVLTKFFYWLSKQVGNQKITELDAEDKLHALRLEQDGCIGESFGTISAYGPHAALPHYSATPDSNAELKPQGLYLLDSGGQFYGGTTDTTRVISLGKITEEERTDYTLVLKGMIGVSRLRFPRGTCGYQIDALARAPQWMAGINYGHGTGHGVGYFLNVHEGPQSISPNVSASSVLNAPLLPGMITSVEPGIYRTGKHGVRIENLVLCVEDETTEFGSFIAFETLTIAPIFTNLVDKKLLTREELAWLRKYNGLVLRKIGRYLTAEEKAWVKQETRI
ncbi:MAG: aminopeptidase P family protein [Bacteroidetes bacterium]|nr:MAG: aminopeptidase P family protein [Bacteroidota bacterium]